MGYLAEHVLRAFLDALGTGEVEAGGWKLDAYNWGVGAFYFFVAPAWIWLVARGFTRLVLGPVPKRAHGAQA
jgi:hypothetical protein